MGELHRPLKLPGHFCLYSDLWTTPKDVPIFINLGMNTANNEFLLSIKEYKQNTRIVNIKAVCFQLAC